jgi:hypothetical protein
LPFFGIVQFSKESIRYKNQKTLRLLSKLTFFSKIKKNINRHFQSFYLFKNQQQPLRITKN